MGFTQEAKLGEANPTQSPPLDIILYCLACIFMTVMYARSTSFRLFLILNIIHGYIVLLTSADLGFFRIILRTRILASGMQHRNSLSSQRGFSFPSSQRKSLRYLTDAAPVKQLGVWWASRQTAQSPLLAKPDPVDW